MNQTPEHSDPGLDRVRDADEFQVVYQVKRPSYEFAFVIPATRAAYLSGEQAYLRLHFRDRHQEETLVLELKVLEDFYESLSRLMEYLNRERQKSLRTP
jgi:hypothetical protein